MTKHGQRAHPGAILGLDAFGEDALHQLLVLAHGADPVSLRLEIWSPCRPQGPAAVTGTRQAAVISALAPGANPASPTRATSSNIHSGVIRAIPGPRPGVGTRASPTPSRSPPQGNAASLRSVAQDFHNAFSAAAAWHRPPPAVECPPCGTRLRVQVAAQSALAHRCIVCVDPPTIRLRRHKRTARAAARAWAPCGPREARPTGPLCRPWRWHSAPDFG